MIDDHEKTFDHLDLSGFEIGSYDPKFLSKESDIPMEFSSDLFSGVWKIVKDERRKQNVWLLRVK